MNWLLWREDRRNRLILGTGVVLVLLPYVLLSLFIIWNVVSSPNASYDYGEAFFGAILYSLCVSQLTLALIAGNAMAGERADRSAEFLAYLPLERSRLLMSKLVLALLVLVAIWGINSLFFGAYFVHNTYYAEVGFQLDARQEQLFYKQLPWMVAQIVTTGLTFFGVAWLISSFQSSTTFAVAGGLVTPLVVIMIFSGIAYLFKIPNTEVGRFLSTGYMTTCLILAIASFGIGTGYYLKRREP